LRADSACYPALSVCGDGKEREMIRLLTIVTLAAVAAGDSNSDRLALRAQRAQRIQKASGFLATQKPGAGFTGDDTFQAVAAVDDSLGRTHVRFRRFYKGVRVYKGDVKLAVNHRGDAGTLGRFDHRFVALPNVKPVFTADQARSVASSGSPRSSFKSELIVYTGDSKATSARLTWLLKGTDGVQYIVDAVSGSLIARQQYTKSGGGYAIVTGSGYTRSALVPITNVFADGEYALADATRGSMTVYDMRNKQPSDTWYGAPYHWTINTWGKLCPAAEPECNDWEPGDSTYGEIGQTAAVEALYAARATYDMLWNVFSRKSLDDSDGAMKLRVHARKKTDEPYGDAHWDNEFANFGDGDVGDASRTDLSTVAHELGHGLFQYALGEDNSTGEAAGINEGHGDIMAAVALMYTKLADQQGHSIPTPSVPDGYFKDRSLRPWNYYSSDGSQGLQFYVAGMGDKEEHTQGCVYGRVFAMLVKGAPATFISSEATPLYTPYLPKGMMGIGAHKAAMIWYLATIAELDSDPTFEEAREAWLEAAEDLFGADSDEYKSVNNAFAGVNLGSPIDDKTRPEVFINTTVDDAGQNVYVEVTAADDLGVSMEIRRDGDLIATVSGSEYRDFIDLSGISTGPKTIQAKVCDVVACKDWVKGFTYQAADHLLKNGRFESMPPNWQNTTIAMFQDDPKRAFLGRGFVEFGAGRSIWQAAQVPTQITKLKLGFRVSVNTGIAPVQPQEYLYAEILDENYNVLQTLVQIDAAIYHDYAPFVFDLPPYSGQKIVVRFRSSTTTFVGRFKLDNAYLVYKAPPRADFTATVDENEGSVIFLVEDITNIGIHQVKEIEFSGPSIPAQTVPVRFDVNNVMSPLQVVTDTQAYTTGIPYTVNAKLRTWNNEAHALGSRMFTVKAIPQLIRNGRFELQSDWQYTGNAGYGIASVENQSYSFLGGRFFWLGGEANAGATLKQWISLPPGLTSATLTLRLSIISHDKTGDQLTIRVRDEKGNAILGTLAQIANNTVTNGAGSHNGYRKFTYSLLPYAGKVIYISFESKEDASHPTWFWIDNVGVTHTP
jgi:Zn-dependent metalloprotease